MMKIIKTSLVISLGVLLSSFASGPAAAQEKSGSELTSLMPDLEKWKSTEETQIYYPESLFEYINGAAEIYLSYEFRELAVNQYVQADSECNIIVEIYAMGNSTNAFGIYSAERFPDNKFVPVGLQGYLEEGTLNFLTGSYYVKLMCFDCEPDSKTVLESFAQAIINKVTDKGAFPSLLEQFPATNTLPNTEKFILTNFMGYAFLQHGFMVTYQYQDWEFECFIIAGKTAEGARKMLEQYLQAKSKQEIKEVTNGYHIKDRYYANIYVGNMDKYVFGVIKIKDGSESMGLEYFQTLLTNLK